MRKFQITSEKLDCEITFIYSDGGKLTGFFVNNELTFEQLKGVIASCFFRVEDLLKAYTNPKTKHLITEILPDLTFTAFFESMRTSLTKNVLKMSGTS